VDNHVKLSHVANSQDAKNQDKIAQCHVKNHVENNHAARNHAARNLVAKNHAVNNQDKTMHVADKNLHVVMIQDVTTIVRFQDDTIFLINTNVVIAFTHNV
jgi:hypothetical protein